MKLDVYVEINGESRHVGYIETAAGSGESFTYDASWLKSSDTKALSLSLPLRDKPYPAKAMRPYFEGLLPEGAARNAIAARLHVSYAAYLKILDALGHECIGAISLSEPSKPEEDSYIEIDAAMLDRLSRQSYPCAAEMSRRTHFSLAGSQAKIALYRAPNGKWYEPQGFAPSTHILKPTGTRFNDVAVNELICMMTARKCGLSVSKAELIDAEEPIICTERFDRDLSQSVRKIDGWPTPLRLHQEDFCQALGIVPEHKYEEGTLRYLDRVVLTLRNNSTDPIEDLNKLWDMVVFNYLIGNCDFHLKNIALLRDTTWKEIRLSPAYDLVCTSCYSDLTSDLAMSIGGERKLKKISFDSFETLAETMMLPKKQAQDRLEQFANELPSAFEETLADLEKSGVDCAHIGEVILNEINKNIARL